MIEAQAELVGERVAVVCGEQQVSFGELNERANQVAWRLRRAGVEEERAKS